MNRALRCASWSAAVLLLASAASTQAQEIGHDVATTLVVLDAVSLAPIPAAEVTAAGVGSAHTDASGRVTLLLSPDAAVRVASLGYQTYQGALTEVGGVVTVVLSPDPIAMDRLDVVVDRLEYRRARVFDAVRVIDRGELARESPGALAANIRVMVGRLGPCSRSAGGCQGDPAVVLLDDWVFPFRMSELEHFEPAELYAVEVYPRLSLVRVYTQDFMKRAMDNPRLVRLHGSRAGSALVTANRAPTFAGAFGARVLPHSNVIVAPFRALELASRRGR